MMDSDDDELLGLVEEEDWTDTSWAQPPTDVTTLLHAGTQPSTAVSKLLHVGCQLNDETKASTEATKREEKNVSDPSVVKRMLLNDNKAGMEGLDKEKINQIIHEASKGSRYYENEKTKEDQMRRRIDEQKKKISSITEAQLREGLIEADRLLEDFEQQRDLSNTIVHTDMDAFYAAVEMRDRPELKHKPMAVGGTAMLSTSNYHARKFGVRAAMPGFIGKKLCPDLVIVPTNFDKYIVVSKQVRAIFTAYDPNFCPMSLDEAYLDITGHLKERKAMSDLERTFVCRHRQFSDSTDHCLCDLNDIAKNHGSNLVNPDDETSIDFYSYLMSGKTYDCLKEADLASEQECLDKGDKRPVCPVCNKELPPFYCVRFGLTDEDAVNELRTRIEQKTLLTASAGIAPNMMLAKVCSDKNKPNGQFKVPATKEDVINFIKNLPTRKISGIGKVSEAMLNALGVYTCTDLYERRALLYHLYSSISFNYFMRICLGIGSTTVERDSERKSMSTERTFSELSRPADLYQKCEELCEALAEDLKTEQLKGKTVGIKIKTVKFEVKTRAHSLREYTSDKACLLKAATDLLRTEIHACAPHPLRLRLMGVRMSNLLLESHCTGKKQNTILGAFKKMQERAGDKGVSETVCHTVSSHNTVSDCQTVWDFVPGSQVINASLPAVADSGGEFPLDELLKDDDNIGGAAENEQAVIDCLEDIQNSEAKSVKDNIFYEKTSHPEVIEKSEEDLKEVVHHNSVDEKTNFVEVIEKSEEDFKESVYDISVDEKTYCVKVIGKSEEDFKEIVNEHIVDKKTSYPEVTEKSEEEVVNDNIVDEKTYCLDVIGKPEEVFKESVKDNSVDEMTYCIEVIGKPEEDLKESVNEHIVDEKTYCPEVIGKSEEELKESVNDNTVGEKTDSSDALMDYSLRVGQNKSESNDELIDKKDDDKDMYDGDICTPPDNSKSVIHSYLGDIEDQKGKDYENDTSKELHLSEISNLMSNVENVQLGLNACENEECHNTMNENLESSKNLPCEIENTAFASTSAGLYQNSNDLVEKVEASEATPQTDRNVTKVDMTAVNGRKTRSGQVPKPNAKQVKKRRNSKRDQSVSYSCPICMKEILCADLNQFNSHVDECLNMNAEVHDHETDQTNERTIPEEVMSETVADSVLQTDNDKNDLDDGLSAEIDKVHEDIGDNVAVIVEMESVIEADGENSVDMKECSSDEFKKIHQDNDKESPESNCSKSTGIENEKVHLFPTDSVSKDKEVIEKTRLILETNDDKWDSFKEPDFKESNDTSNKVPYSNDMLNIPSTSALSAEEKQLKHASMDDCNNNDRYSSAIGIECDNDELGSDNEDVNAGSSDLLVCPICNVEQACGSLIDFNNHVDACLSRGAIKEILSEQRKKQAKPQKRLSGSPGTSSGSQPAKRRKTVIPQKPVPCRSIVSFFKEK